MRMLRFVRKSCTRGVPIRTNRKIRRHPGRDVRAMPKARRRGFVSRHVPPPAPCGACGCVLWAGGHAGSPNRRVRRGARRRRLSRLFGVRPMPLTRNLNGTARNRQSLSGDPLGLARPEPDRLPCRDDSGQGQAMMENDGTGTTPTAAPRQANRPAVAARHSHRPDSVRVRSCAADGIPAARSDDSRPSPCASKARWIKPSDGVSPKRTPNNVLKRCVIAC
jgi:hypothetical protein